MKHAKIAVLLSGKGSNLQALLHAEQSGRLGGHITKVISDQPEAGGLGIARERGIPSKALPMKTFPSKEAYEQAVMDAIESSGATLVCLAGYMRLLGETFVRKYEGRLVNIHPSLLPAFPGIHGVRDALASGVQMAGCTVHFVEHMMDAGPVIAQAAVPVLPGDTESTLHARIQREEHRLYPEVLGWLCAGRVQCVGRQVIVTT